MLETKQRCGCVCRGSGELKQKVRMVRIVVKICRRMPDLFIQYGNNLSQVRPYQVQNKMSSSKTQKASIPKNIKLKFKNYLKWLRKDYILSIVAHRRLIKIDSLSSLNVLTCRRSYFFSMEIID